MRSRAGNAAVRPTRDVGGASCSAGIGTPHCTPLDGAGAHPFGRIDISIDVSLRRSEEADAAKGWCAVHCTPLEYWRLATAYSSQFRRFRRPTHPRRRRSILLRRDWHAPYIAGISIALLVQSLDPLECGVLDVSYSTDMSLRWSEEERRRPTHPRRRRSILLRRDWHARHIALRWSAGFGRIIFY